MSTTLPVSPPQRPAPEEPLGQVISRAIDRLEARERFAGPDTTHEHTAVAVLPSGQRWRITVTRA